MPKPAKLAIAALALVIALFVTAPKLVRMAKIRGFIPGATTSHEIVAEKWHETPDQHPRGGNTYWITWSRADIQKPGHHRMNLSAEQWNELQVGEPIEIVRLPSDSKPYLRDGIYASTGNFVFDVALLVAMLGAAAWAIISALRD